jgi:hypothetical protein
MAIFIWFTIRDILLILAGTFLIIADHQGWAALILLFFLIILIQSFRRPEENKNDSKE